MTSRLLRGKLLIVSVTISVFLMYFSYRYEDIKRKIRGKIVPSHSYMTGPVFIVDRCKELGPIQIIFSKDKDFESNAIYLQTGLDFDNICSSKTIDICESGKNCKTIDLRLFTFEYFKEVKDRLFRTRVGKPLENLKVKNELEYHETVFYDIYPDHLSILEATKESEYSIARFVTLGVMFGLALITGTYLDTFFEYHFLCEEDSARENLRTLIYLDKDQGDIYESILENLYSSVKFGFVADSPKPFRKVDDPDPFLRTYTGADYPTKLAAKQIFVDPYIKSRDFIFTGMRRIIFMAFYNSGIQDYFSSYGTFSMRNIFSHGDDVNVHNWKDNSEYSFRTKIFWKAIFKLPQKSQQEIFELVTGYKRVPLGGCIRLPKTKIVEGKGKMFPEKFLIVIDPDLNFKELQKRILNHI